MKAYLIRILLALYITFSSFTAWLALTGWLRVPVVILLLITLLFFTRFLYLFFFKTARLITSPEDVVLIVLTLLIWVSFTMGTGSGRSFNHALSYTFVFFLYNILCKHIFIYLNIKPDTILKYAAYGFMLPALIVIVEWAMLNFFGVVIRQYFILTNVVSNMVFYDQFFFKSVGGVCEEPSLMAMNINVLFPMGYIYVKKYFPGVMLNIYSGLFVLAQIFMASSGGIGFFLLALIIYNTIYINPKVYANIISIIAVVGIIGGIIFIYLPDDLVRKSESFVEHVSSKIFFKNRSASMRTEAWNYGIEDWFSSPIVGKGPGFGNEGHNGFGYQSCYIKLMAEMGTPSTLLFILFLAVVVYRVLKLPREYRKMMFFSTVSCIMHFMIADGYYHIPFWIAVSFVQYFFIYQKTQKHLAEA